MSEPNTSLCYAVLTPFKFRGAIVKPPAFVQMSADEAREYQDADVLGGDDTAALPPEPTTDAPQTTEAKAPTPVQPTTKAPPAANKKAVK